MYPFNVPITIMKEGKWAPCSSHKTILPFSKITIYWCFEERNKHKHHPQNNTKFPSLLLRRRCLTSNQSLIQTYVCSMVVIMGWSFLEESISYQHLSEKHLEYNINYVVNYILVDLKITLQTVITKKISF